ncbi:MAG: CYTH domain-containing protein [Steroidobacteraceae bacterium]
MSLEIERKFLVRDDRWRGQVAESGHLRQGYLANAPACSVRVRVAGHLAWLSVKGMQPGRVRDEFEYEIPGQDAEHMLAAFGGGTLVEKIRHRVPIGRHEFEVDEFLGANEGLVIAEIELDRPDEEFPRPPWLGDEVTDYARYYNFRLADAPFRGWPEALQRTVQQGQDANGGRR